MKKHLVAIFCIVLLLSGAVAVAQTITGSVRGTVTDPSGAVVAGAKVAVTNTATGVITRTVTDKSGLYNVGFLVLGNYTVTATATGFETASVGPFIVQIDQIVTADAKLSVGKASTTVNVSAGQSLLLDTENSTISTSIS
jgi:predicted metalloprotease